MPEAAGWWVCSHTRLTPCLYALVFNPNREFCVLVTVMPKILYHPEEAMYDYWAKETIHQLGKNRVKREPITTITLVNMFGLGIAGAGTRITSLTMQNQGFTSLRAAIDKDITRIEQSISHLEESPNFTVRNGFAKQKGPRLDLPTPRRIMCDFGRRMLLLCRPHWGGEKVYGKSKKKISTAEERARSPAGVVRVLVPSISLANNTNFYPTRTAHYTPTHSNFWSMYFK